MSEQNEGQPQSEVDRIIGQLGRNKAQVDPGEDPNSPQVTKRNIDTNLMLLTSRAQVWKMRNRAEEASQLIQKGFRRLVNPDLFTLEELKAAGINETLDKIIKTEEDTKRPLITEDINNNRHFLESDK